MALLALGCRDHALSSGASSGVPAGAASSTSNKATSSTPGGAASSTPGSAASSTASSTGSPASGPTGVAPTAPRPPLDPALEAQLARWQPAPAVEACADCHPEHVEGFAQTGMGRALYRPNDQPKIEDFSPEKATITHPETGVLYQALIDADGRWWQEERLANGSHRRRVEVKYVVGSGNHTRSYIGEVDGELMQMPLTWYSGRRIWDMSPGYDRAGHMRFDRPIKAQCVFCHNDLSPVRDETLAGFGEPFATGITCNRCHGNGAEHVKTRLAGTGPAEGQPDPTILNPKRLDNAAQLQICQQCHLPGHTRVLHRDRRWDAYDPRVPLDQYMSIYAYAKDGGAEFGIASHGHRTAMSRCFTESKGALTCTTCHDPHKADKSKASQDACLGCHKVDDCGDEHASAHPGAGQKTCAECHMYKGDTSDIPHVQFTDHFIRKRPRSDGEALTVTPTLELVDALAPPGGHSGDPADAELRLAMAHHDVWRFEDKPEHGPEAIQRLVEALKKTPDRPEAWHHLARLYTQTQRIPEALQTYTQLDRLDPKGVLWRLDYALMLEGTQQLPAAELQLLRAVQLAPNNRLAWGNLGNVLQRQARFSEAEAAYDRADAIGPHASTANNRGYNALAQGKVEAAEAAFREALRRDGLSGRAYFNLGQLALRRENAAEALKLLGQAVIREPGYGQAWFVRGRVRISTGDLAGARDDFQQVVQLEPQRPFGYIGLAEAFNALAQPAEVVRVLNQGVLATQGHPVLAQLLQRVEANPAALDPKLPLIPPGE